MYEGPSGSANTGIPLQLPPDSQKLSSSNFFDLYRSMEQKEIIIYAKDYKTDYLCVDAVDLEKLIFENFVPETLQESSEEPPAPAQLFDRTANWEVYAAPQKIFIKPTHYHPGQLFLTFKDLKILRGLSSPR